jgi:iron complex outermembrane receptor protein
MTNQKPWMAFPIKVLLEWGIFGGFLLGLAQGVIAAPILEEVSPISSTSIHQLNKLQHRSNQASYLVVQDSGAAIQVTGVKLKQTSTGIEVVLETSSGVITKPITRIEGNTFVADVDNAVLALPGGAAFKADKPMIGVISITVVQLLDGQTVQVRVVGIDTVPIATVKGS